MALLSAGEASRLLRVFAVVLLPVVLVMRALDSALQTRSAAHGIVSFEFCAYSASCAQQIEDWALRGQQLAMLSLGLDYLFILSYVGLLWLALTRLALSQPAGLQGLSRLFACLVLVAGAADGLENYALIQVLLNRLIQPYADFAAMCASIKFTLLLLSLGWLCASGLHLCWRRR